MFNNYSNWSDQWLFQNDGLSENEHQLSVAGKIKKHFNTGPKPSNNTPGVSVMTVSPHWHQTQLLFSCLKLRINIKVQTPCVTVEIYCEYYRWCYLSIVHWAPLIFLRLARPWLFHPEIRVVGFLSEPGHVLDKVTTCVHCSTPAPVLLNPSVSTESCSCHDQRWLLRSGHLQSFSPCVWTCSVQVERMCMICFNIVAIFLCALRLNMLLLSLSCF